MHKNSYAASLMLACLVCGAASIARAQLETPVDIVATQVRSQGHACINPSSAELREGESAPDRTVYVLACEGVSYRVTLIPDEAAIIEKLE